MDGDCDAAARAPYPLTIDGGFSKGGATLEGRRAHSRHCAAVRLPWPTIPGNPTSLGGRVTRNHIVLDVFGSQVSLQCGSYGR